MESISDMMFVKRFCLPINTDMNSFRTNRKVARECICGNYFHMACTFKGKLTLEEGKASLPTC
jgi:hypothetical protein